MLLFARLSSVSIQSAPRMRSRIERLARRIFPARVLSWVAAYGWWMQARLRGEPICPPRGFVRFGSLRRTRPVSRVAGADRGRPIDRYYIEKFLAAHANDIRGHVLEVAEPIYTRKFGGARVTRSDVLHVSDSTPPVTVVADLAKGDGLPSSTYDCIVLTQTLPCIYDVRSAVATLRRILAPGGVLLATMPGIGNTSRYDMDRWGWFWAFTSQSAERLFQEVFPKDAVSVETHGNVLASAAFLYGLATQELTREELERHDPDYELLVTVRATKPHPTDSG